MKHLFTFASNFLKSIFAADSKHAVSNVSISNSDVALISKEAQKQGDEARTSGRNNFPDAELEKNSLITYGNKTKDESLFDLTRSQALISEQLEQARTAYASFDEQAQVEKERVNLAGEKEKEYIAVSTQHEKDCLTNHQAELAQQDMDNLVQDYVDQHGTIGTPSLFDRFPMVVTGLGIIAESAITANAMISAGTAPLFAGITALGLSSFLSMSSYKFGKESCEKSRMGQLAYGSVAVGISAFIGFFRGASLISLVSMGALGAFWLASARGSFRYHQKARGFALNAAKQKADKTVIQTRSQMKESKTTLSNLDERYDQMAEERAIAEGDALKRQVETLALSLIDHEQHIAFKSRSIDHAIKEGTHTIEKKFRAGKHRNYSSNDPSQPKSSSKWINGSIWTCLILLSLIGTSCKETTSPAETFETVYCCDKTASMEDHGQDYALAAYNDLLKCTGLDQADQAGDFFKPGICVRFYIIKDNSIPQSYGFLELKPAGSYATSNVPKRNAEVSDFKRDLWLLIQEVFALKCLAGSTQLHRSSAHVFQKLAASKATHKSIFFISDFLEQGTLKFYQYSPEYLRAHSEEIRKQLLQDAALPDLKSIETINMIIQSKPGIYDELSYRAALDIFKPLWEQAGGTVTIQNNF